MNRVGVVALTTLVAVVAAVGVRSAQPVSQPDGWATFEGAWSASGTGQSLATELGRPAAIHKLSGAVTLQRGALARGFRGEVIAYYDGSQGVGRAVWVDSRGDQIFSELTGEPVTTGRVAGTFTGGTGRYSGITGDYAFTWRYVIDAGAGQVQGHTEALSGRYRLGGAPR